MWWMTIYLDIVVLDLKHRPNEQHNLFKCGPLETLFFSMWPLPSFEFENSALDPLQA